jgi:hypothetical protein
MANSGALTSAQTGFNSNQAANQSKLYGDLASIGEELVKSIPERVKSKTPVPGPQIPQPFTAPDFSYA